MNSLNLTNQTAIVTGAGRGIGKAIAQMLAQNGARVIAAARTEKEITATANEINQDGGEAFPFVFDLAQESSIQSLFAFAAKQYGSIDIVVNNAAIGRYGLMHEFSARDLQDTLDINVRGTYICCQEALRLMIPRKSGYIINIASVVGFKGYPNQSAYTASKHAVVGLTKSLAAEAQEHNIRVTVINPGGTATNLVADARPDLDPAILMQPQDVAQTVQYLLSLSERCAIDEIYIRRRSSKPF